jgi:hypothetical protein
MRLQQLLLTTAWLWAAIRLAPGAAGPAIAAEPGRAPRLQPPPGIGCARDQLTAYAGRVRSYRRAPGVVFLEIATDWGTIEPVTLSVAEGADPAARFLLNGARFAAGDWARIEVAPGRLRPGLRATAWVCDDGGAPLIDWAPPAAGADSPGKPR